MYVETSTTSLTSEILPNLAVIFSLCCCSVLLSTPYVRVDVRMPVISIKQDFTAWSSALKSTSLGLAVSFFDDMTETEKKRVETSLEWIELTLFQLKSRYSMLFDRYKRFKWKKWTVSYLGTSRVSYSVFDAILKLITKRKLRSHLGMNQYWFTKYIKYTKWWSNTLTCFNYFT